MNMEKLRRFLSAHRAAIYRVLSYVLVAVLTACVTVGVIVGTGDGRLSKLDALESLILDRFIGEADQKKMEDAAADAMVGALGDQWSYYIPADQMASYQEEKENAYVGIGITIIAREDGTGLDITQVSAGGSAEEAGLLAGDTLIAVDGESIAGMQLEEIRNRIRGEKGTQVQITVLRGGTEHTVAVTRKQIKTPVAEGQLLDDGIGLVRIVNFNENCASETKAAIEELLEQGAEKLIFDVRYNPGGYARELVSVLDYLLPEGPLFRTENYAGQTSVENSDANCLELPMAVLVNGSSYSAAEFFAAALSEYEAAVVLGEQTSGKGYYQSTFLLPDGSAVGLSIGKYYTPSGVSLAGVGITPDVAVPVDDETAAAIYAGTLEPEEDPQIKAAIQALQKP